MADSIGIMGPNVGSPKSLYSYTCLSDSGDTLTNDVRARPVKVQRDMQDVTTEGYRTLGIVSTFIAGVEAQCLSLVSDARGDSTDRLLEAADALLLVGLLLSAFGAAISLLAARWFDLPRPTEVDILEARWEDARRKSKKKTTLPDQEKGYRDLDTRTTTGNDPKVAQDSRRIRDLLLAKAVQHTLLMVLLGFYSFIIGMLLYAWATRSNIAAIISTIAAFIGTVFVICLHLDFHTVGTLQIMEFNRIRL